MVDPEQNEYRARITELGETHATLFPFAALQRSESPIAIEVFQALPAKERFELVLQKCTEIGNTRIVPFTCSRSSTQQERDAGQKKSHRWPDVLLRAARQCRRALIPELYPVLEWSQALQMAAGAELALLCFEGEGCWPLGEALQGFRGRRIALVVGPEGGFSQEEVEQARGRGILPISLGPRILRTETAAIVASGAIQYALGDLGRVGG